MSWAYHVGIGTAAGVVIFSVLRLLTGFAGTDAPTADATMAAGASLSGRDMGAGMAPQAKPSSPVAAFENSATAVGVPDRPLTQPSASAVRPIGSADRAVPSTKSAKPPVKPSPNPNIPLGI